jgi:hypothetical protein
MAAAARATAGRGALDRGSEAIQRRQAAPP